MRPWIGAIYCLTRPRGGFESLSLFAGGFDLEAVEAIWSGDGEPTPMRWRC